MKLILINDETLTLQKEGRLKEHQVRIIEQRIILDTGTPAVGHPVSVIKQLGRYSYTKSDGNTGRLKSTEKADARGTTNADWKS